MAYPSSSSPCTIISHSHQLSTSLSRWVQIIVSFEHNAESHPLHQRINHSSIRSSTRVRIQSKIQHPYHNPQIHLRFPQTHTRCIALTEAMERSSHSSIIFSIVSTIEASMVYPSYSSKRIINPRLVIPTLTHVSSAFDIDSHHI